MERDLGRHTRLTSAFCMHIHTQTFLSQRSFLLLASRGHKWGDKTDWWLNSGQWRPGQRGHRAAFWRRQGKLLCLWIWDTGSVIFFFFLLRINSHQNSETSNNIFLLLQLCVRSVTELARFLSYGFAQNCDQGSSESLWPPLKPKHGKDAYSS